MSRTLITLGLATSCLACAPNTFAATHIAQSWKLHKVSENGAVVVDAGTVHGSPYGLGTIRITTTAHADGTVTFTFRERLGHGSVTGLGRLTYSFTPSHDKVFYRGAGTITGGTGRCASAKSAIKLTGTGYPDAHAQFSIASR